MAQFLERYHRLIAIIGFVFIVGILTIGLIFGPFNGILPEALRKRLGYHTSTNDNEEITVQLVVNFNGFHIDINETIIFKANQTATVYSILLAANLTVETKEFPNGLFIEAIEGVWQNTNYHWWYFVDNISGGISADRYNLRTNDVKIVKWVYKNY